MIVAAPPPNGAVQVRPIDNIGGLFSLFTMSFCVAMAGYKLSTL